MFFVLLYIIIIYTYTNLGLFFDFLHFFVSFSLFFLKGISLFAVLTHCLFLLPVAMCVRV